MKKKFFKNQLGNVAVSFALASVGLIGVGGAAVDYASQISTKSHLQGVADAAVLVAANELKLSGSQSSQGSSVSSVADAYVKRNIDEKVGNPAVKVVVSVKAGTVDLNVSGDLKTSFFGLLGLSSKQRVTASARAQILGGLPLCVLALDTSIQQSLTATSNAKLTATGCSVHTNSKSARAIEAWGQAKLRTGLTCSAGGAVGGVSNYIPVAVQDCPQIPDPLASRFPVGSGPQMTTLFSGLSAVSLNSCTYTNLSFSSGNHILTPGRYCGGLKLTGNAEAKFRPGVYIMDAGKFEVTGNAEAEGEHVVFYFTGNNAFFGFHDQAEVEFSAPADSEMAGILFLENPDRNRSYVHEITSSKTKSLVGAIYLPKSELRISVNGSGNQGGQVAQESAFTVILARKITLNSRSNLVLNTDFAATDVPVPESIKRLSGQIVMSK